MNLINNKKELLSCDPKANGLLSSHTNTHGLVDFNRSHCVDSLNHTDMMMLKTVQTEAQSGAHMCPSV